jgi:hypothetical protein
MTAAELHRFLASATVEQTPVFEHPREAGGMQQKTVD